MRTVPLIVGLGNPGPEYAATRHNMGFFVIDDILATARERKSMRLETLQAEGDYQLFSVTLGGVSCLLAKPMTFMNLSGRAVARICGWHGVGLADVVVVHDELDLSVGRMKLKRGGGSNGHKGVDSIVEHLGSEEFLRLRLGIGRPEFSSAVSRWVLESFAPEELETVRAVCAAAHKGLTLMLRRGAGEATQFINSFRFPASPPGEATVDTSGTMG
ncbi:MAG: aminoacyl-tRNA hydrolase [Deltaproteobacteria bacterium HGW-Deltaproteobacteria-8]|nr:MAG: aminoacyl-tRNA hydrolase [Deltaproteobacteria bacterium HGW-Deltaproteobacteria-8]